MLHAQKFSILFIGLIALLFFYYNWIDYKTSARANLASVSVGFKTEQVSLYDLLNGKSYYDFSYVDELACLSSLVYNRDTLFKTYEGWRKVILPVQCPNSTDEYLKGLYYEVWKNNVVDDSTVVAIVFKGTESFNDWKTNSRWIRRLFKSRKYDYYEQLDHVADSIINSIRNHIPRDSIKIITAGHSLGGGLAQFMAYRIDEIKTVYAFNSSPVTGYYDLTRDKRIMNSRGCKIFRIYESGEVLSTVRKFMTILYPAPLVKTRNPALIRVRTSFTSDSSIISQHSMSVLARNLNQIKLDSLFEPRSFKIQHK